MLFGCFFVVVLAQKTTGCRMLGDNEAAERYLIAARRMAAEWVERAPNGDGSYRLAFDRPGNFSMKYNMVWNRLFCLNLFPDSVRNSEVESYRAHSNPYELPLDNCADYTKSDWLVWMATLADSKEQFAEYIHPLWLTYHLTPSRVPMTDWYSTITSVQRGFQNRTVLGGLFIKLLVFYLISLICKSNTKCFLQSTSNSAFKKPSFSYTFTIAVAFAIKNFFLAEMEFPFQQALILFFSITPG